MSKALVLLSIFAVLIDVSAVGRNAAQAGSLRAQSRSTDPSVAAQDPSPAELEEEEEEDGTQDQEVSMPQPVQREGAAQPPVAAVQSPAADINPAVSPEVAVPISAPTVPMPAPTLPSVETLPQQGPTKPQLSLAEANTAAVTDPNQNSEAFTADEDTGLDAEVPSTSAIVSSMKPAVSADEGIGHDAAVPSVSASASSVKPVAMPELSSALLRKTQNTSGKVLSWSLFDHGKHPSHVGTAFHADAPPGFEPLESGSYQSCNPPCIQGRGICNDNLCFCKSPYTGTTCQHKVGTLARVSYPMLVAFSIVSVVFGVLFAQLFFAWISQHFDKRLSWGEGALHKEVWCPPVNNKGKN